MARARSGVLGRVEQRGLSVDLVGVVEERPTKQNSTIPTITTNPITANLFSTNTDAI